MSVSGIVTYLWFDTEAEQVAEFYSSVFPDTRVINVQRYGPNARRPEGSVLAVTLEMFGQTFVALNGGPEFKHSEAVSFSLSCDNQEEIDRLWSQLTSNGGQESECGWCKDRFGVSWQVQPRALERMLSDPDHDRAARVWSALMTMRKIDIARLEAAANAR